MGGNFFINCATDWIKVCLMQDTSGDSTIEARNVFEQDAMAIGIHIKGYHADNGRYAEHSSKNDCANKL